MGKKILLATVLSVGGAVASFAEDVTANTVQMPAGVDIPGMIGSGVAVLGTVVGVALAAWAGWVLVKKCLQWVRKSFN